jgi:hypothetical protein
MEDAIEGVASARAGKRSRTSNARYVIHLVHGTWAKKAPWVQPRSALSRALRERLPEGTRIFPFVWSGKNTNKARRLASERLLKKLALRVRNYSDARHYIIGHSHGGNVVLHALAHAPFQDKIAGVVCLSTPFLVARSRDLGRHPWKHIAGAVVGPCFFAMWWIVIRVLSQTWWGLLESVVLGLVLSLALGSAIAFMKSWREYGDKLLRELESPKFNRNKTLIVRTPGDEASGGLDFLQLITRLTVGLWVHTMSLYERIEATAKSWAKLKKKVIAVAAALFLALVGFICVVAFKHWGSSAAAVMGIFVLALVVLPATFLALGLVEHATFLFFLLASALMWPVIVLLSVPLLFFGWEVARANILLDVTAETTPTGAWTVHLVEPPTTEELGKDVPPLMHSVVYENPHVLRLLCDWIAEGSCVTATSGSASIAKP